MDTYQFIIVTTAVAGGLGSVLAAVWRMARTLSKVEMSIRQDIADLKLSMSEKLVSKDDCQQRRQDLARWQRQVEELERRLQGRQFQGPPKT